MKTINVNISNQTVTVNNETCNFYEAGLSEQDPNHVWRGIIDRDIIEEHLSEREEEELKVVFEDKEPETLAERLALVLASYDSVEPNIKFWVDDSAVYAVFEMEDGEVDFLYMHDIRSIDDYIDEDHEVVEINYASEGVGSEGVFWMNEDFDSPHHVTDFEKQINTVKA